MMRRNRLTLCLSLACILSLALPALLPAQSGSQPPPAEKKKTRKVWTNEDFASGSQPAAEEKKEETPAAEQPQSAEALFAELDQARTDYAGWQKTLELYRQQLEEGNQRLRDADNDYDRDAYRRSVEASEQVLANAEETVKQLAARIAELETLTKGMKRPTRKPGEKNPNPQQLKEAPPGLVSPAAGPKPEKEQPPPPPIPPSS